MARAVLLAVLLLCQAVNAETYMNIYGAAKHEDNDEELNERNYGFGLRGVSGNLLYEAGFFRDSRNNVSKYAGAGYQYRLGFLGAGISAFAMSRPNYRDGEPFLAALPFVTLDAGTIVTNITYIPPVNDLPATFFVYWSMNPFLQPAGG